MKLLLTGLLALTLANCGSDGQDGIDGAPYVAQEIEVFVEEPEPEVRKKTGIEAEIVEGGVAYFYYANGEFHRGDGPASIYYYDNNVVRCAWYLGGDLIRSANSFAMSSNHPDCEYWPVYVWVTCESTDEDFDCNET